MSSRHLLTTLRRAWWIPALSFLLGGLAALGVSMVVPPGYTATTQLFLAPSSTGSTGAAPADQFSQQRIASYTELLTGQELARRVIADQHLPATPQNLARHIIADSSPNSLLINVQATDSSPAGAQRIAQAIDRVFPEMVSELEGAGGQAAPIRVTVVAQPDLPTRRTSPNVPQNLVLGCLAGLFVGLGTVVARDRMDRTVKGTEQAEEVTAAPVLGVVLRQDSLSHRHVVGRGAVEGEGFREIRTNLQFVSVDRPPRTILISSALPGEGTTTLTVNLARVFADAGRKVTVVEADLRRPMLTSYLGLVGGVGLTNVLAGEADVAQVTQVYDDGPFDVIGAGPAPPDPGDLLSSSAVSQLLARLREENDIVLLDAAPLLSVADTAGLAPMTDGVLLTVRYGHTRGEQLRQAVTALRRVGARTLGVVVNLVPAKAEIATNHGVGRRYGYSGNRAAQSRRRAAGPAAGRWPG